ncbi:hypothetical protein DSO57_1012009 [Entomophthora muscae]|uniref:Uncharacterized protein n=1 Tax=Entomophthora muscae TaxID=34485 RepID=A0ACC2UGW8_9FUNG|nr:hypothetical protein DSO57_1012009 [Entomophthora muscae]
MDLSLAQFLGLLLPPQTLVAASKVPVLCYPLSKLLSYFTGNHVFVSKFSAIEDLLYPVIVGVGWWRRHLVQINVLSNKLHFLLDGTPGFFLLLLLGEDPLSCVYHSRLCRKLLLPLFCPACWLSTMTPLTLSCQTSSPHFRHDLTLKLTMDLINIDAPMYPLSELEDKALGVWLDNMLAKGWIVKKASLVSSLVAFA